MIFNFTMSDSQLEPYACGIKRFFVVDDVDNIYVNDFLLFSDSRLSMIFRVDYIDKQSPELQEGTMLLSLSPCEVICRCNDCPQLFYHHGNDEELPFY